MSIKLIRNSGLSGALSNFNVLVNGKKVATIANKECKVLDLKSYPAKLKVTSFGSKSNEITVNSGDIVQIKSSKANTAFMVALFILLILIPIIESTAIIIIGFAILIILAFTMQAYELNILDRKLSDET